MMRLKKVGILEPISSQNIGTSKMGLGFEKLDRGAFDPSKAYDKMAATGIQKVRIQSGWARTEKSKGIYDFAWLDEIVDNIVKRGMEPWLCLCYGNGIYDEDAAKIFGAVGCPPIKNAEQKQAWHNYVRACAMRYTGKIKLFEVWNEPDGEWCWKHGVSATEYGNFSIDTAQAVREGNREAKMVGGVCCMGSLEYMAEYLNTGVANYLDYISYHAYIPNEIKGTEIHFRPLRALCLQYNHKLRFIQGETGTQSRHDGAGALHGGLWTEAKQAKYMARHMTAHILEGVEFCSYFSCMDMYEALNGAAGDKASYKDFGYFGVLGAAFDQNGIASGEYRPKKSYRTLQTLARLFSGDFSIVELPIRIGVPGVYSQAIFREDDDSNFKYGGLARPNGAKAFVYWKTTDIIRESYSSTVTIDLAAMPGPIKLIDLIDGAIYELPPAMIEDRGNSAIRLLHLPLLDSPLMLTFGDFA